MAETVIRAESGLALMRSVVSRGEIPGFLITAVSNSPFFGDIFVIGNRNRVHPSPISINAIFNRIFSLLKTI